MKAEDGDHLKNPVWFVVLDTCIGHSAAEDRLLLSSCKCRSAANSCAADGEMLLLDILQQIALSATRNRY